MVLHIPDPRVLLIVILACIARFIVVAVSMSL